MIKFFLSKRDGGVHLFFFSKKKTDDVVIEYFALLIVIFQSMRAVSHRRAHGWCLENRDLIFFFDPTQGSSR